MTDRQELADATAASALLTVRTREHDGVVILSVTGELDISTAPRVGAALRDAVARRLPLVLDLTELRFFSSAGLGLLVSLHESGPVTARIAGNHHVVRRPLELCGLLDLFPIDDSVAEAVTALTG